VEGVGQAGQRHPGRGHQHLGHRQIGDRLALGDYEPGAAGDGVGHEAAGVLLEARNRDEAVAGLHAPGIGRQATHRRRRGADHAALGQGVDQQSHGDVLSGHVISRRCPSG